MTDQPETLLIANRGVIALRILRTCRKLGLRAVCITSEADRSAPYLAAADAVICVGPADAQRSYLNTPAILAAARAAGATLIHPGYGFLSENADFAAAVGQAGLTLVGPSPAAMRLMGDKVSAKRAMLAAGVPCVPGPDSVLPDDLPSAHQIAAKIGYPVILKAAAGGGGRGMRIVAGEDALETALMVTRQEAQRFFGNPAVYMEKFLDRPRHVEIQVIADQAGHALWLGDRDCSMQRRHQKVIEEGPAPGIDRALIAEIGTRCARACTEIGYSGVGTFEFLYQDGAFYFIEMNTRIQVEHPVTELVTGLDIVALQIDMARGRPLTLTQDDVACRGHAVECRITAEDPQSFAPSPGRITDLHLPGGPGIRIETHIAVGSEISPYYDSMIAKVLAHGATRGEALDRLSAALAEMRIGGVSTNIALQRRLLSDPGFVQGGVSINHLERLMQGENHA